MNHKFNSVNNKYIVLYLEFGLWQIDNENIAFPISHMDSCNYANNNCNYKIIISIMF